VGKASRERNDEGSEAMEYEPFGSINPDLRPCQVCGELCGSDRHDGYSSVTISQVKAEDTEELAYLCLRCFAGGILHAARLARSAEIQRSMFPYAVKVGPRDEVGGRQGG